MFYELFFLKLKDFVGESKILKEKLDRKNELERFESCKKILSLKLKSPTLGLVLSISFGAFGVDRFYQGNISHALLKLSFFILYMAMALLDLFAFEISNFAFFCVLISYYALIISDWVVIMRVIKNDNLRKILMVV